MAAAKKKTKKAAKKKTTKKAAKKKTATKKKTAKKAAKKTTRKKATAKRTVKKKTAAKRKTATRKKAAKKTTKKAATKKVAKKATPKKAAKKKTTKRKPNPAFMKPMTPSSDLAAVIGSKPMPRTEVTKKLWAYIKKNGLQDDKNRRMINADDKLKKVFDGKKQVSMFDMTKHVSKHLKG